MSDIRNKLFAALNGQNYKNMSVSELAEIVKETNQYQIDLEKDGGYTVFSASNLREQSIGEMKMLAIIGFLYRAATVEFDDVMEINDVSRDSQKYRAGMMKKAIIKEFLDKLFGYNPDTDVATSHVPNPADLSRRLLAGKMTKSGQVHTLAKKSETTPKQPEATPKQPEVTASKPATAVTSTTATTTTVNASATSAGKSPGVEFEDVSVPSRDLFYKLKHYETANYDRLRELASAAFTSKFDLDWCLQIHKHFEGDGALAAAEKYASEHTHMAMQELFIVRDGKWKWLAPFKANQDRVNLHDEGNRILKSITARVESESKFAEDMLSNRVYRKKRQQIKRSGMDADGLESYIQTIGGASSMKRGLDAKQREKLKALSAEYEKRRVLEEKRDAIINKLLADAQRDGIDEIVVPTDIEPPIDPRELYDGVDKDGVPLDAIILDTFVNDGKENLNKVRMFTKAMKPGTNDPVDKPSDEPEYHALPRSADILAEITSVLNEQKITTTSTASTASTALPTSSSSSSS